MKWIWTRIVVACAWLVELNEIATDFLADWLSRFARRVSLVAVLIVGGGVTYKLATASRNSAGTMSAINGPYAAPNVISSAAINARFADVESEITNSVDKGGRTTMTGQLPLYNGTSTSPSFGFAGESTAGLYRVSSGIVAMTFNGTESARWTANGLRAANGAVATPSLSFLNDTGSGLYRGGSNDLRFAVNGVDQTFWGTKGLSVGAGQLAGWTGQGFGILTGAMQSQLYMQDTRGAVGNKVGKIIYDGGSNGGGTGNLSAPGWQFQVVDDTGAFSASGFGISRAGGIQIGNGTAISASYRGTTSWTPGSITAGTCVNTAITLTGATVGSECAFTSPLSQNPGLTTQCQISNNTCTMYLCNGSAGSVTGQPGTYGCRVFND